MLLKIKTTKTGLDEIFEVLGSSKTQLYLKESRIAWGKTIPRWNKLYTNGYYYCQVLTMEHVWVCVWVWVCDVVNIFPCVTCSS